MIGLVLASYKATLAVLCVDEKQRGVQATRTIQIAICLRKTPELH